MLEPIKKEIKTEEKKAEEVKRERIEQKFFDLSSYTVEFKDVIHIYWWSKESFRAQQIKTTTNLHRSDPIVRRC